MKCAQTADFSGQLNQKNKYSKERGANSPPPYVKVQHNCDKIIKADANKK